MGSCSDSKFKLKVPLLFFVVALGKTFKYQGYRMLEKFPEINMYLLVAKGL